MRVRWRALSAHNHLTLLPPSFQINPEPLSQPRPPAGRQGGVVWVRWRVLSAHLSRPVRNRVREVWCTGQA